MYSLDMNTNFNLGGFLSTDTIQAIEAPTQSNWRERGVFFYDNTSVYIMAGDGRTEYPPTSTIWSYNASTEMWNPRNVSGGSFNYGDRSRAWYASDPASGTSYLFGNGFDDQTVPGMIKFDSSNPQALSWINETTGDGQHGDSLLSVAEGAMSFVRLGKKGVLVGIGGYDVCSRSSSTVSSCWLTRKLVSM